MKFVLVFAVVLVAFWIWRNNRQNEDSGDAPASPRPGKAPVRMVACRHCGTHVPEAEQITGRQGNYCCAEHRRQAEDAAA